MPNNMTKYDAFQVLRSVYDIQHNALRVSVVDGTTGDGAGFEVIISHTDDSIRLGDGTNLTTVTQVGSRYGLDVNVINPLNATNDNVAIRDSDGDELKINSDGSLNINVTSSKFISSVGGSALNALIVPVTDVSDYDQISVQISGTFSATVTWEASNNNSTWVAVLAQTVASSTTAAVATANAAGIFKIPVSFRYFRARISTFTSGTMVADAVATQRDTIDYGQRSTLAVQSGTWNVGNANASVIGTGAAINATPIALTTSLVYDMMALAITGTWVGTLVAEATNDGTNFFTIPVQNASSLTSSGQMSITANGLYRVPLDYNQVRVRVSAYTSGTVAANAKFSSSSTDALNPKPVVESGQTTNTFNSVSSVPAGVLTTISSYTPTFNGYINQVAVSGTNIGNYQLFVNGIRVDNIYTYYGNLNGIFDLGRGIAFNAGNVILVRVIHNQSDNGDFNARIQTVEG